MADAPPGLLGQADFLIVVCSQKDRMPLGKILKEARGYVDSAKKIIEGGAGG